MVLTKICLELDYMNGRTSSGRGRFHENNPFKDSEFY